MGSGTRKSNTEYVAPDVADGITVTCPKGFAAVRAIARTSIAADSHHPVSVDENHVISIGEREVVATVTDAPEALRIALASGCAYKARFVQRVAEGETAYVEFRIE